MTTRKKRRAKKSDAMEFLEGVTGKELTFSDMLFAIREGEELSQVAFAELLGISRQNLCDLEKGRKGISPARAAHFAEVLGYPEEVFVALALQDEMDRSGLKLKIFVKAA